MADDLDTAGFDGAKYVWSPPPRDTASQAACIAGIEVIGFPVRTMLRGKTLVADGALQQPKGMGRYQAGARSGAPLEA